MTRKTIYLLIIFMTLSIATFGQKNDILIRGNINTNSDEAPIIQIGLQGTNIGTTAKPNGQYTLKAPPGRYKLKVFAIGFQTITRVIKVENSTLQIPTMTLEPINEELEEVVVTGTKTRRSISNAPVLTKLISEEEIEQTGCVSALDAIESAMPGIQFSPDAHGDNMTIQGLDNSYVLVLLDGERLVGETRGNINFDRISANDIKQIEIISGASSVLYGSNAIGGVINIITKNTKKSFEGKIDSRYSRFNTLNNSIQIGTKQEKFSIRANGFLNTSDGYDLTPETPESYTANPYIDYSGNLTFKYHPNDKLLIKAHGTYFRHESLNPETSFFSSHNRYKNYTAGSKVNYSFSKSHKLVFGFNSDVYEAFKVFEKFNDSTSKSSDFRYYTFNITDSYDINKKIGLVTGAELNMENIYSAELFGKQEGEKDKDSKDINFFSQVDWKPIKKLEAIAGIRYTGHSSFGSHVTPNMSLMYRPISRLKFRGTVALGYKSPSLKQLYYNFDHQGMFWIYGNENLKPEKANYYSLSTEYTYNTFNISVNAYHNTINNKIDRLLSFNKETGKSEYHHYNIKEAQIRGIETTINWSFLSNFKLKTSYTFVDAVDKSTNLQMYGNSKHTATTALTFFLTGKKFPDFSVTLTGRMASPRLYQVRELDKVTNQEVTKKNESEAYSIWKIAYIQQLSFWKVDASIKLGIDNLFDYSNLEKAAVINPGRIFWAGLSLKF